MFYRLHFRFHINNVLVLKILVWISWKKEFWRSKSPGFEMSFGSLIGCSLAPTKESYKFLFLLNPFIGFRGNTSFRCSIVSTILQFRVRAWWNPFKCGLKVIVKTSGICPLFLSVFLLQNWSFFLCDEFVPKLYRILLQKSLWIEVFFWKAGLSQYSFQG